MNINEYKGVVKLNIYGEDRYFKFGTAQMAMLCQRLGKPLSEVAELQADPSNLLVQIEHYYCAAVCYARLYNDETKGPKMDEPTYNQVANWFDGLSIKAMEEINETAYKTAFPNVEAPEKV